jgi:hypothetical protein
VIIAEHGADATSLILRYPSISTFEDIAVKKDDMTPKPSG